MARSMIGYTLAIIILENKSYATGAYRFKNESGRKDNMVTDIIIEAGNDHEHYDEVATQEAFDRF